MPPYPIIDDQCRSPVRGPPGWAARGQAKQRGPGGCLDLLERLERDGGLRVGHDAGDCRSVICPALMESTIPRRRRQL
jgi:hypothetical protein